MKRAPGSCRLPGHRDGRGPLWAGLLAASALVAVAMMLSLSGCKTTTTIDGAQVPNNASPMGVVEGDAKKRAAVRLQLAANYYQSGQVEIAIETARRAIDLDPESVGAHALLGLMLMDVGQVLQADESFKKALALDRNNPDVNNNYGWFLCQTGHERDSIAYFERALADRLYSSPARALQNAGICLLRIHDDAGAERYLLRALQSDATSPVAKFQLAQMYLHQRRFDRCDFYFDLLVRSVDPNAETLWLGARIAHAKNDEPTERSFNEQLQSRFPDSPQTDAMHHGRYDE
jgi:type IV pilus assembly protein PilF